MKVLYGLLILVPVVLAMELLDIGGHSTMFVLSALALIPLAAVLGNATEEVAVFTGPKIGGLLNATLGNAAELIITIVALREGLVTVVKASIAGSIIGNMLIVLGAAVLLGGLKHGTQRFNSHIAGVNAAAMSLAVMALIIPAIFALGSPEHRPSDADIVNLSDGTAVVLIVLYALYLVYTIFTGGGAGTSVGHSDEEAPDRKGLWIALGLLTGSTIAIVFMSEILVGALEPTAESWGMSELFVAPVLVLVSQFVGPEPMSLVFNQFELVALIAAVFITVLVSVDGRTNWLEGAQLIALYLIIGIAFWFVP